MKDARMKTVIGAQAGEQGAFREYFRGGGGYEQFIGVESVDDFAGFKRIEFDAEIGVSELGAVHHLLDAFGQGRFRLCAGRDGFDRQKQQGECYAEEQATRLVFQNRILQRMRLFYWCTRVDAPPESSFSKGRFKIGYSFQSW